MDCLRVQELLSSAHDGAPVAADEIRAAREHCRSCDACSAFLSTLELVERAGAPAAPPGLVTSIETKAREHARQAHPSIAEAAEAVGVVEPESAEDGVAPPPRRPWSRFVAFASAAVVLALALSLTAIGIMNTIGGQTADDAQRALSSPEDFASEGPPGTSVPPPGVAETDEAIAPAPEYVSVAGWVYVRVSAARPQEDALVAAGAASRTFEGQETTEPLSAFALPDDTGDLYIDEPEAGWVRYAPVTRTLALEPYQLRTGSPIAEAGQWPTLPVRFAAPLSPDGAPTFRLFGSDDRGIEIYVVPGTTPAEGFAVAPGTSADDPAAGNPGWTWWEPVPGS
ncbi:MAG: hypothetical protein QMC79_00580 [Anaerosomatales bacterium]|nr:hypothetical protein [Anaerosomatales bacterium]